jgi:hypothetical protein
MPFKPADQTQHVHVLYMQPGFIEVYGSQQAAERRKNEIVGLGYGPVTILRQPVKRERRR